MIKQMLPKHIPVFPLTGAILLPKGILPLNIFEPRYCQMVEYAHENGQVIGMIQPLGGQLSHNMNNSDLFGTAPRGRDLYSIGCVGKMRKFEKTGESQYFIALEGLSRFYIIKELPMTHLFREVEVSYGDFTQDGHESFDKNSSLRTEFYNTFTQYLKHLELDINRHSFNKISDEEFINSIAMICPFDAAEKQLLVEANSLQDRTMRMMEIMNFNLAKHDISSQHHVH